MALNFDSLFRITAKVVGEQDVQRLKNSVDGLGGVAGLAKGALAGLAAALTVDAVVGYAMNVIRLGDELWTLHERTGVAVEDLSKFSGAAEDSGTSLEAVAKGLNRLNRDIGQGNTSVLQKLGIDTTNATTAMLGLADVMARTNDPALRTALAIQVFGKSGADLVPMLSQGREAIESMAGSITSEFAQSADAFGDQMAQAKRSGMALVADALLPLVQALADVFDAFNGMQSSGTSFRALFVAIGGVVKVVASAMLGLWTYIQMVGKGIGAMAAATASILTGEFAQARDITQLYFDDVKNMTANMADQIGGMWSGEGSARPGVSGPSADGAVAGVVGTGGGLDERGQRLADKEARDIAKAIEANQKRVAGMLAEASTLRMVSSEREKAVAVAELEASILNKRPAQLAAEVAALKAAFDARRSAQFSLLIDETTESLDDEIAAMRLETDTMRMSTLQRELMANGRRYDTLLRRLSKDATDEERKALEELIRQKELEADAEIRRREAMGSDWMAGARQGLTNYYDQVKNTFKDMAGFAENFAQRAEGALVEFFSTGRLNMKAFVADMLKELLRIWIRAMIMKPILQWLGVDIPTMPSGRAIGGAVAGGTPYMVGERGPELFVPSQSGRIVANNQLGGGGGVSVVVNVAANGSTSTQGDNADAQRLGSLIGMKVRDVIIQEKRTGGLLAAGA